MRQIDKPEDLSVLGKKIVKQTEEPEPKRVGPGVFKDADGRFRTIIPGNEAAKKKPPAATEEDWEICCAVTWFVKYNRSNP
jgi:hypothetical protein